MRTEPPAQPPPARDDWTACPYSRECLRGTHGALYACTQRADEHGDEQVLAALPESGPTASAPSLALEQLFTETGRLVFRAAGTCMYPAVQPGDLLHVVPKPVERITVGEIAVFRRAGVLFGHRTIATGSGPDGHFIITRPDRSEGVGDDGPLYAADVLGVIDHVRRAGQMRDTTPYRRWCDAALLALLSLRGSLRQKVVLLADVCQRTPGYPWVARGWFRRTAHRQSLMAMVPFHGGVSALIWRKIPGAEVEQLDLDAETATPALWKLVLQIDRKAASTLTFIRRPPECPYAGWWLAGVSTRRRFRQMGAEEALLAVAERVFARAGVRSLFICLPPGEQRWLRRTGAVVWKNAPDGLAILVKSIEGTA